MKLKLYEYLETETNYIQGDLIGEVIFENGECNYNIIKPFYREKIIELFSSSFQYLTGTDDNITNITVIKTAQPNTPEFFENIIFELPRHNIKGVIEN